MPNALEAVKQAAMDAVKAGKPTEVLFGTVISADPLKIQVEQKLALGEKQIILCRNVKDYPVEMSVEHFTEETDGHQHPYRGKKVFLVHNRLKAGEEVVLLRVQGGQKYLVIDRL